MSEFCLENKATVSRLKLLEKGFVFNYTTHQESAWSKEGFLFCYEFGYKVLNEDDILIVRHQPANSIIT